MEILSIKENKTYQMVLEISNWDDYFNRTRERLSLELSRLQEELGLVSKS
jgi:hypothetical protein